MSTPEREHQAVEPPPQVDPTDTIATPNTGSSVPSGPADPDTATFLAPPERPDELGRLGSYRILSLLGKGGMGAVFRAEDPSLKRQIALKVMLRKYAANDLARRRFLREAEAQAAVEHDHIISIFQVGEDRGVPFIAMPLLKGQTLAQALKANPRPPLAEVLRIGREIAEGLAAAHERGLMHRDIKPGNIWLEDRRRRVKILDFGLARAEAESAADADAPLTTDGTIVGTPAYMSPEQARGESVDHCTDLFSLGVVLYQMATGELPFRGPNAIAILTALAVDDPPPPLSKNSELPIQLDGLIRRLLAKNPAVRPQSAEGVSEVLRSIEEDLGRTEVVRFAVSVPNEPWSDIEVTEASEPVRISGVIPPVPRRSRVAPWMWLALGALVLGAWVMVAALFVTIATPKGTLVIESDDPEVEVIVKKDGTVIVDKTRQREIELKVGDYAIELADKKDGLRLMTDKFAITKNGKETVRVRLEKPMAKKPKDKNPQKKDLLPVAIDPHRRATEMVLKYGGTVRVRTYTDSKEISVSRREELPVTPFILLYADCRNREIPDEALRAFEGVHYVPWVEFTFTHLTDRGVNYLSNLRCYYLALNGNDIGDNSVKMLSNWQDLRGLQIPLTGVSDAGMQHLMKLPRLRVLNLSGSKITDVGIKELAANKTLWHLRLGTPVTAGGVAHLKQLPCLQQIMLDTTGDEAIESLSRLTRPRMVQLFEQSVGDEAARRLQKALPNAAIIHKAVPPTIDERDAIQWALEQKAVIATDYSGGSLKEVPKTTFFVTGLTMPEGGPKAGAVKLRGIRCIDALLWNGLENADAEAEHLATLDSLVTLQLSGTNLSAKGIERLTALRQLEQLFLFGDSAITDEALSQLPKFEHLWNLQLSDSPITDAGLEHLGHLPDLHFLVLANCPKLNGVGLKHLAALPVLRQLHLGGTPLDDTAIPFLKQLTSLFILDLTRTKITENGVGELHIALPRCAIIWDGGLIVPGTAPVVADPDRDPTK